mgnify:CR=1 FL=1
MIPSRKNDALWKWTDYKKYLMWFLCYYSTINIQYWTGYSLTLGADISLLYTKKKFKPFISLYKGLRSLNENTGRGVADCHLRQYISQHTQQSLQPAITVDQNSARRFFREDAACRAEERKQRRYIKTFFREFDGGLPPVGGVLAARPDWKWRRLRHKESGGLQA